MKESKKQKKTLKTSLEDEKKKNKRDSYIRGHLTIVVNSVSTTDYL